MTKKPEDHLPKTAPKRTGKRGIKPVDEEDRKTASAEPKETKAPRKLRGKTGRLPGLEDPEIEELEDAAREYANVRDDRMLMTREESSLKDKLLVLMKKNKKETYRHDDVEVKLVHEEETVKVRIIKEKKKKD